MQLLNGKVVAEKVKNELKERMYYVPIREYRAKLAIVSVGDDAASSVYINNKKKFCDDIGLKYEVYRFLEISQTALIKLVRQLNDDSSITGIIVQLPLPDYLNEKEILECISPQKDVDGFHAQNIGSLALGNVKLAPCTPMGIMRLLNHYKIDIDGKHCVIVGRSNIVGKPMALMMLNNNATVTVCHSHTKNLEDICKTADILICAIGKPKFFNKNYIKEGAVVVDVGIHRQENGKLCGDVDFEDVKNIVSAITPVPGGVGVMTVAMLCENCVKSSVKNG